MRTMEIGIFSNRDNAEKAVSEFQKAGYQPNEISFIMKENIVSEDKSQVGHVMQGAAGGITTGGIIGSLAGLLIGVGAIVVPGLGALLIGGPIATALGITGAAATTVSGAITGALAGGLVGGLIGLGVPEKEARQYEERIKAGGVLVAVPAKGEHDPRRILEKFNADQINTVTLRDK